MNLRKCVEFLYRRGNEVQGIRLGLSRIRALMEILGNPQEKFSVLHIAGTNGKGSVAAMAESILRSAGWKTGIFTSPHLERIQERIRTGGSEISGRRFASLISRLRLQEEALLRAGRLDSRLTFFEFVTAAALLHFADERVQIGVIEVGLGGGLDATNIVLPKSCVITGISLDHMDLLGDSLKAIARAKAGIVKPGVPVVSGCRAPEARRVIRLEARRKKAPLVEIDRECEIKITGERSGRIVMDLRTPRRLYLDLRLALAGRHQARNAALAVAGIEALSCFPVTLSAVRHGLAGTRWPGRMDVYRAYRRTLLDGAHNPEAARLLCDHLQTRAQGEIHLVFGAMRDKDFGAIGEILFPLAHTVHLTRVSNPRSAAPEEIANRLAPYRERMRLHASARAALRAAWAECPRKGWVVVTGSLYLVGELLSVARRSAAAIRG